MVDQRFIVVLEREQLLDPDRVLPALLTAGVLRADALRVCRRQRGILFTKLPEDQAACIASELTRAGVDATALPEEEFHDAPRPIRLSRMEAGDEGVRLPTVEAVGGRGLIPWEEIRYVVAGLVLAPAQHTLKEVTPMLASGATTHEDHVALARATFERREQHVFPLREYLSALPEESINLEFFEQKPRQRKISRVQRMMRRFDLPQKKERFTGNHPGLEGTLYAHTRETLYRLDGHEASFANLDPRFAGHWLRGFQALSAALADGALGAFVPESTQVFARGDDSAAYIYHDEFAIEEHLRWLIYRGGKD